MCCLWVLAPQVIISSSKIVNIQEELGHGDLTYHPLQAGVSMQNQNDGRLCWCAKTVAEKPTQQLWHHCGPGQASCGSEEGCWQLLHRKQLSCHLRETLVPIQLYMIYKAGRTILLRGKEGNKDKIASRLQVQGVRQCANCSPSVFCIC